MDKLVHGEGSIPARVMLIGEAPGAVEEHTGRPFVGPAGKYLDELLVLAGLKREDVFITNCYRLRPPGNRPPTAAEVKEHASYLDEEVELVQPEIIVLLGKTALNHFFKGKSLTRELGHVFERDGRQFLVSLHPAARLHNPRNKPKLEAVFLGLGAMLRPAEAPAGNISAFIVAIDTEIEDGKVFSKAYSFSGTTPQFTMGRTVMLTGYVKVFHNAVFDIRYLRKTGEDYLPDCETGMVEDTMVRAALLGLPHGLKLLALAKLNRHLSNLEEILGTGKKAVPMRDRAKEVHHYCLEDARATRDLLPLLALPSALEKLYRQVEIPSIPLLVEMEENGLGLDIPEARKLELGLNRIVEASKKTLAEYGLEKPASTQQVSKLLYKDLGLPVSKLTPKEAPSTDKAALVGLRDKAPAVVESLLEFRSATKLLSTYILPWLSSGEPRIYPHYNQCGTETGRWSSSDPDGENIAGELQKLVIPAPGYMLVEFDADQIEMRIAAMRAKDKALLRLFSEEGADVHEAAAIALFGKAAKGDKERRKIGKTMNFAVLYGGSEYTVAEKAQVGLATARLFSQRYFQQFPELKRYIDNETRKMLQLGYVESSLGRIRRLPDLQSQSFRSRMTAIREGVNMPVQGTAADAVKLAGVAIRPAVKKLGGRFVLQVYDSWMVEVPKKCPLNSLSELASEMTRCMEENLDSPIPLPFHWAHYQRWGESSPLLQP